MSNRLSQLPVEVLIRSAAPIPARLSQAPIEVLVTVEARLSHLPLELLVAEPTTLALLDQLPLEVLVGSDALVEVWLAQMVLEAVVLVPPPTFTRLSQVPVEVALLSDAVIDLRLAQTPVEVLTVQPPLVVPPGSDDIAGSYVGLTWVEWALDAPGLGREGPPIHRRSRYGRVVTRRSKRKKTPSRGRRRR